MKDAAKFEKINTTKELNVDEWIALMSHKFSVERPKDKSEAQQMLRKFTKLRLLMCNAAMVINREILSDLRTKV